MTRRRTSTAWVRCRSVRINGEGPTSCLMLASAEQP